MPRSRPSGRRPVTQSSRADEIDNKRTPDVPTHYAETCIRCHTTGYYPGAANGGYADAEAKAKYDVPDLRRCVDGWAATTPRCRPRSRTWPTSSAKPATARPPSTSRTAPRPMVSSQDEGVCNQCHNGGGHHLKGTDLSNAEHSDASPLGVDHYRLARPDQACVRCHSGDGYVSFLKDPTNPAAWDNSDADRGLLHLPRPAQRSQRVAAAHRRQAGRDAVRRPRTWGSRPPASSATTPGPRPRTPRTAASRTTARPPRCSATPAA